MKIGIRKQIEVDAKTLKIYCKVSDRFSADLVDEQNEVVHSQEDGYVPNFMPGDHDGDYLVLNIDIDTGQVVNWTKPTKQEIQDWINDEQR